MRKSLMILAVICLLFLSTAAAEPQIYAGQGGVRVYAENGRVGLMDAEGRRLTKAIYKEIYPFDGEYAVVRKNGKYGVLRRDGSKAVSCKWRDITGVEWQDEL